MVRSRNNATLTVALVFVSLTSAVVAQTPSATLHRPQPAATPIDSPQKLGLDDLTRFGLGQNPRLAQAAFRVDSARGRALQAGLYPNPTVSVNFDELGDRTGPAGVNTLPLVSQEIVTAGKLRLDRAAANREVDQANLALMGQRYGLLAAIRQAYFDVLTLEQRIEILRNLVRTADQSVGTTQRLLDAKLVARLDLIQLDVERERLRAEAEATERELPAAYRRLAAVIGGPIFGGASLSGTLEAALPDYDLESTQQYVLNVHPELQSARVGVDRAQLSLRRAQVQPIPNVTVGAGYVRQNQNRSDDWTIGASIPVPIWNRNQGAIQAAHAHLAEAHQEVVRVENDLVDRVATAFRDYAAARQRAERYQKSVLALTRETYDLSLKAYQGGQFEYLRVLEAQRAMTQANLEYVRALGDAWKSASILSGLTLEEHWPARPPGGIPCEPGLPVVDPVGWTSRR